MVGDSTPRDVEERSRPRTESSYGIPESETGMLPWEFVEEGMAEDRSYWLTTVRPDGFPHVRPVWGLWLEGTFYCGGGEQTRWVRNLAFDPSVVVHRQDAETVVILEGIAERIDEETADASLVSRIDAAYETKYEVEHGTPFFAVAPDVVLAWSEFPTDATRWTFDA